MKNAFQIVTEFENRVADYTGAPFAVAVDSCTNAVFLSLVWFGVAGEKVEIPKRTYISVPNMIHHAGAIPTFRDEEWSGLYKLKPYPIFDAARRFTKNMFVSGTFMCLSFHGKKHLGIGRGGMILTDKEAAVIWLKQARFDGRHESVPLTEDAHEMPGWHMYMTPELAARGLERMMFVQEHNDDLPYEPYQDLSKLSIWRTE